MSQLGGGKTVLRGHLGDQRSPEPPHVGVGEPDGVA